MKRFVAIAVIMIFLSCVAYGITGSVSAQEQDMPKIIYSYGLVSVNLTGEKWVPATVHLALNENSRVKTFDQAYCDIAFDEKQENVISLGPNTEVAIGQYMERIEIAKGRVFSVLNNIEAGSTFEVVTPQAIAGVRGTAWETIVELTTKFNVKENVINVQGINKDGQKTDEKNVSPGNSLSVDEDGWLGELVALTDEDIDRLENWSSRIEDTLRSLSSAKGCGELIESYEGASKNLFAQVMNCEAGRDVETFASSPGGGASLLGGESGDQGITGGDIINPTFFSSQNPPALPMEPPPPFEPPVEPPPDHSCCPATNPFCSC